MMPDDHMQSECMFVLPYTQLFANIQLLLSLRYPSMEYGIAREAATFFPGGVSGQPFVVFPKMWSTTVYPSSNNGVNCVWSDIRSLCTFAYGGERCAR